MTLEEVCKKYDVSVSSMTNNFQRTKKSIMKKYHIEIIKKGRGKTATYEELIIPTEDGRALTMYEENKDELSIDGDSLHLMNWDFMVFLAIITTPMLVFRGNYHDFLTYIDIQPTENNMAALRRALDSLAQREYIIYVIDKTNTEYFVATLYRKVEQEMKLGIDMVRRCKALADKNNKRNWISLLKTWVGLQVLEASQPFTLADLSVVTGLSKYQIMEAMKLLKQDEVFITKKVYIDKEVCVGQNIDFNGFLISDDDDFE